jgi:hypothetical protein
MAIAFDIIKFLQHIMVVGILFAALTYICDKIYPAYTTMYIQTAIATNLSYQVMGILHTAVGGYIIIGFILACINAVAAAQSKRNMLAGFGGIGSSGINTGITGSLLCGIFLMVAIVLNFALTGFFDLGINTIANALPTPDTSYWNVIGIMGTLWDFAHLVPMMIAAVGFITMLFYTFANEAIEMLT